MIMTLPEKDLGEEEIHELTKARCEFARDLARAIRRQLGACTPSDGNRAAALLHVPIYTPRLLGPSKRGGISKRGGRWGIELTSDPLLWGGDGQREATIAEELGHILLGHASRLRRSLSLKIGESRFKTIDAMEHEAQVFASELLHVRWCDSNCASSRAHRRGETIERLRGHRGGN
jgi:hypothetical protein